MPRLRTDDSTSSTRTFGEMKAYLGGFPGDLASSTERALAWVRSLPGYRPGYHRAADRRPRALAFAGLGGSAFAGDVVRAILAPIAPLPLQVIRDYRVPAWVERDSLLIASSYSGDTEETLAAFQEALERGVTVWAIASGGELARRAEAVGAPLFRLPPGLPPRAALGHSLPPALLGAVLLAELDVEAWADALVRAGQRVGDWSSAWAAEDENPARALARRLATDIPVFYASEGLYAPAAVRWRGQLAENAKMLAFHHLLPEMDHNEIVGWQENADLLRRCRALFLTGSHEHPRVARRIDVTAELIQEAAGDVEMVRAPEGSPLEELLALVSLGDYVSLYAAAEHGVEPVPVERIARLKTALGDEAAGSRNAGPTADG